MDSELAIRVSTILVAVERNLTVIRDNVKDPKQFAAGLGVAIVSLEEAQQLIEESFAGASCAALYNVYGR